jgi:hypothetical protein
MSGLIADIPTAVIILATSSLRPYSIILPHTLTIILPVAVLTTFFTIHVSAALIVAFCSVLPTSDSVTIRKAPVADLCAHALMSHVVHPVSASSMRKLIDHAVPCHTLKAVPKSILLSSSS